MREAMVSPAERRLAKRVPLNLATRIRHSGLEHGNMVIHDLSFTGFKGKTDVDLAKGAMISVSLPNIGLVRATVKWCRDHDVAAQFHRPVDVRVCFRQPARA
jgi:hypothetical protein